MVRLKSIQPALAVALLLLPASAAWPAKQDANLTELEKSITCRRHARFFLTERSVLNNWAAGASGNETRKIRSRVLALENARSAQRFSFVSEDGRKIRGWKVGFADQKPTGAVLVASGNFATAALMLSILEPVARAARHDYYFLDYRGYGLSQDASPSIQAFVRDFVGLGQFVKKQGYEKIFAYGPSIGGVILLRAAASGLKLDRLIVDSVPSDLEIYDCEESLAPENSFKDSCPNLVAITSTNDDEFPAEDQEPFLTRVKTHSCGGRVVFLTLAAHAPNDAPGTPGYHERMGAITMLLTEEGTIDAPQQNR